MQSATRSLARLKQSPQPDFGRDRAAGEVVASSAEADAACPRLHLALQARIARAARDSVSVTDPGLAEERLPARRRRTWRDASPGEIAGGRSRFHDALIIGCDQVAVGNGEVLGKPGTRGTRRVS